MLLRRVKKNTFHLETNQMPIPLATSAVSELHCKNKKPECDQNSQEQEHWKDVLFQDLTCETDTSIVFACIRSVFFIA